MIVVKKHLVDLSSGNPEIVSNRKFPSAEKQLPVIPVYVVYCFDLQDFPN